MVSSAKTDKRSASDANSGGEKTVMPLVHTRRSGSPFKCISNIVNQVHMEKEQELRKAHNRVHELEALLSAKQQEVYYLYSCLYQPVVLCRSYIVILCRTDREHLEKSLTIEFRFLFHNLCQYSTLFEIRTLRRKCQGKSLI